MKTAFRHFLWEALGAECCVTQGRAASTIMRRAGVVDGRGRTPGTVSKAQEEPRGRQGAAAASAIPGTPNHPTSSATETLECGLQPLNALPVVLGQPHQAGGSHLRANVDIPCKRVSLMAYQLEGRFGNVAFRRPTPSVHERQVYTAECWLSAKKQFKAKTAVRLLGKSNSLIKNIYICLRGNSSSFGGGRDV